MKRCPFCDEEIRDAAVKCKHCGEMLGSGPAPDPCPASEPDPFARALAYLGTKRCPHCDQELRNDAKCEHCSEALGRQPDAPVRADHDARGDEPLQEDARGGGSGRRIAVGAALAIAVVVAVVVVSRTIREFTTGVRHGLVGAFSASAEGVRLAGPSASSAVELEPKRAPSTLCIITGTTQPCSCGPGRVGEQTCTTGVWTACVCIEESSPSLGAQPRTAAMPDGVQPLSRLRRDGQKKTTSVTGPPGAARADPPKTEYHCMAEWTDPLSRRRLSVAGRVCDWPQFVYTYTGAILTLCGKARGLVDPAYSSCLYGRDTVVRCTPTGGICPRN